MYAKIVNGQVAKYPYLIQQLYEDNPGVGFPPDLTDAILVRFNAARVIVTGQPEHDLRTQYVIETAPVYNPVRDRWEQAWEIVDKDATQLAAEEDNEKLRVRTQRNLLIAACDWTQLPDSPVDKAAWAAYRQALRDITTQSGFPFSVVWPQEPA